MRALRFRRVVPAATVTASLVLAAAVLAPAAQARSTATATPVVRSVSAASGRTAGGGSIVLRGSNLAHVTRVLFGSAAGTHLRVLSDSRLTVRVPRHRAGTVSVHVIARARGITRRSATRVRARFTYVAPPSVSRVSPAAVALAGGTSITVRGHGFTALTSVMFGRTRGTGTRRISSTELTVIAPRRAAGRVDLRITGRYGTSALTAVDRLTYVAAPAVTSIAPSVGPLTGATITVRGTGFTATTRVTLGSIAATVATESSTQLTVRAPAHAAGTVDLRVSSAYGVSAVTSASRFQYTAGAPPPGPPPVTGLTATSTVGRVTLHWINPAGVTGIAVRRTLGPTAPASVTAGTPVAVAGVPTSAVDDSVADFETYSYSVFAMSGGSYSAPVSAARTAPGEVTGPSSEAAPGRITFSWTNPAGVDHVIVSLSRGGGVEIPPPGAAPTGTNIGAAETYTVTGLTERTEYCLTIFTIGAAGDVEGSAAIDTVTPAGDDTPPEPVTAPAATPAPASVVLDWTNSTSSDAVGVAVARADGTSPPPSPTAPWLIGQSDQGARTFTDPFVAPGQTYTYALWSVDNSGNYSTPVTLTTTTPAGTPVGPVTNLVATELPPSVVASGQSINLRWTEPPAAVAVLIARAAGATAPAQPGATGGWTVAAPSHSFLDSGLPGGTRFSYSVWAVAGDGTYSPIATTSATTDPGRPRPVSGRVLNSVTGQPVSAVPLAFFDGTQTVRATSGADGSYHLDLTVGTYSVCATAQPAVGGGAAHGYFDTCHPLVVGDAPSTTYDPLITPAVAVTGTVLDAITRLPVAGAEVYVSYGPSTPPLETTSGADGSYVLAGLGPGPQRVDVGVTQVTGGAPYGYSATSFDSTATTDGQTVTHDVVLQRLPVITVSGRLTSADDGAGIGGVGVVLMGSNSAAKQVAHTAADGSFTASAGELPGQPVYACFAAEGRQGASGDVGMTGFTNACFGGADFDPGDPYGFTPPIDGRATPVTDGQDVSMTLQPMSTVTGTVRTTAGAPLSGAVVTAVVDARPDPYAAATTDAGGNYVLHTPIRPDRSGTDSVRVCAEAGPGTGGSSAAGYLSDCTPPVVPTMTQRAVTTDVALAPAATLTGTVTDGPSGVVLAGVPIWVTDSTTGGMFDQTVTGADGTYAFAGIDPTTESTLEICFRPSTFTGPGGALYADQCLGGDVPTVLTPVAGTVQHVDVGLVRAGSISGVLRGADTGQPLIDVPVSLNNGQQSYTDAAGRFAFTGLQPDPGYVLSSATVAQGPLGYQAAMLEHAPAVDDPDRGWNITVEPGTTTSVEFMLSPAAALEVQTVTQSGQPVDGAVLELLDLNSVSPAAPAGTTTLTGLTAQPYNVNDYTCASGGTGIGTSVGFASSCVHTPALVTGQTAHVTIVLTPAYGRVSTTVYDAATDQPVPGADVTYYVVDDAGTVTSQTRGTSGAAGIAYPDLPDPPYPGLPQSPVHVRLCVQAVGYHPACAAGDSADGSAGPVFTTQLGVQTAVQVGLTKQ